MSTSANEVFEVPEHIIRLDSPGAPGWQLRYGEWTDYPDPPTDRGGAAKSLTAAIAELQFRIDTLGK